MKKILFMLFVLSFILIITKNNYVVIPKESIRLRIIPASNNVEDIMIKEKLKDYLIEVLNLDYDSINSSRTEIILKKENISNIITNLFKKYNYNEDFKIEYGNNYFPKKIYSGVVYNEGNYESLVITIGKGEGDNFWCVLFPPLCMMENEETKDVEYKFKIKEIIDRVVNKITNN